MKVLYYYYYLFYTRILPDEEPHLTVIFTLSFSESLVVNGVLDILIANAFCRRMHVWLMLLIFGVILSINYFTYLSSKKGYDIIEERPHLLSSNAVSIFISIAWFLFSTSFLFWKPLYLRYLLDQCSKIQL